MLPFCGIFGRKCVLVFSVPYCTQFVVLRPIILGDSNIPHDLAIYGEDAMVVPFELFPGPSRCQNCQNLSSMVLVARQPNGPIAKTTH